MPSDTRKVGVGGMLLVSGIALLVAVGIPSKHVPPILGTLSVFLLAVGTVLVGLSEEDITV